VDDAGAGTRAAGALARERYAVRVIARIIFAAAWLLLFSLVDPVPGALRGLRVLPLVASAFLPPVMVLLWPVLTRRRRKQHG